MPHESATPPGQRLGFGKLLRVVSFTALIVAAFFAGRRSVHQTSPPAVVKKQPVAGGNDAQRRADLADSPTESAPAVSMLETLLLLENRSIDKRFRSLYVSDHDAVSEWDVIRNLAKTAPFARRKHVSGGRPIHFSELNVPPHFKPAPIESEWGPWPELQPQYQLPDRRLPMMEPLDSDGRVGNPMQGMD